MPTLYSSADWGSVRSPAVQEFAMTITERTWSRFHGGLRQPEFVGRGLLLMGPVGTGKSSAAALICKSAVMAHRTVLWQYVPDLIDSLTNKAQARQDVIRRAGQADLLVWDDFGVRDMADWELGFLDQIVERRYREFRPMVITTNLTATDLRGDTRLLRITDRWRERTAREAVTLSGESMRNQDPTDA